MTVLMMDWNSSSVYSRVGKGASLMFEGLNRVHGIRNEDFVSNESDTDSSLVTELVTDC